MFRPDLGWTNLSGRVYGEATLPQKWNLLSGNDPWISFCVQEEIWTEWPRFFLCFSIFYFKKNVKKNIWTFECTASNGPNFLQPLKCVHNVIPIGDNLFKRKNSPHDIFLICNEKEESRKHLFLECVWARLFLFKLEFQWVLEDHNTSRFKDWLQVRTRVLKSKSSNPQFMVDNFFLLYCNHRKLEIRVILSRKRLI